MQQIRRAFAWQFFCPHLKLTPSELMKRKDVMEQLIEAYRSQGLIGEALVDELGTFSRYCGDK